MHGRLKVRTTEEQEERKRVEREKKLKYYKLGMAECLRRVGDALYDETGYKMSEEILASNGDLQTLWNYRRNCLIKFENDLRCASASSSDTPVDFHAELIKYYVNEMQLTVVCLQKNPKSYGSWFHRQWCMERANKLDLPGRTKSKDLTWKNELSLCDQFLRADERNFHCWKHRSFVINKGNLSKMDEYKFTYEKICSNFSNYSSWHYRSKLIEHLYGEKQLDDTVFEKESTLVQNALFTDPNDQSAWIYQKYLLLEYKRSFLKAVQFNASRRELVFEFTSDSLVPATAIKYLKLNACVLVDKTTSDRVSWHQQSDGRWAAIVAGEEGQSLADSSEIKLTICLHHVFNLSDLILSKRRAVDDTDVYEYKATFQNLHLNSQLIVDLYENLKSLSELESDNSKWCLLTMIELMALIDLDRFRSTIVDYLNKLIDLDKYRINYYLHLRSKLTS